MSALQPAPEAKALCAVHLDTVAVFTCTRCGSFGCPLCRGAPEGLVCQACVSRAPPELVRLSLADLLQDTFRVFVQNLPAVGIVALIYALSHIVGQFLVELLPREDSLRALWVPAIFCISLALAAGFMHWVAAGIRNRGERRSATAAVKAALLHFIPMGFMWLFYGIVVTTGLYLLVLPGAYLALCMCLAPAALVLDEQGPYSSLRHSYELVKGHRLKLLGLFLPLFILLFFAVFLSALLGRGLEQVGIATDVLLPLVGNGMFSAATSLIQIAMVLAYLRISRSKGTARR
jgi:hypothetical protein